MEEKEQFAPTEIVKDGRVTRRTFVKGAGWLTITSAIGASALGCAPAQKSESEDDKLAETGPVADPEEGFTYKSACCSVNCTSRCHLRARVKDDKIYTVTPGQMPGRDDYANCCLRSIGLGVPQAAELTHALIAEGFALPEDLYTLDEVCRAVLALKKEGRAC